MSSGEDLIKALEPLVDQAPMRWLLSEASAMRDRAIRLEEATLSLVGVATSDGVGQIERRIKAVADLLDSFGSRIDRVDNRVARLEKQVAELLAARDEA